MRTRKNVLGKTNFTWHANAKETFMLNCMAEITGKNKSTILSDMLSKNYADFKENIKGK